MDLLTRLVDGRNVFFRRAIYQFRGERENIVRQFLENERRLLTLAMRLQQDVQPVTINIPINPPAGFFDPVRVTPTQEQIDSAIQTIPVSIPPHVCAVCQDAVTSDAVEIRHCHHHFHGNCVRQWFETSVRCPVCRQDIREDPATRTTPAEDETLSLGSDQSE